MKYCLSADQDNITLKKIDEIKLKSNDWQYLSVLAENFPNKDIIIELAKDFSLETFLVENTYLNKLIIACDNYGQMQLCKSYNVRFYYKYSITSFYELKALKDLGACYALIGIPLIFDLDNVIKYNIPLRVIPNIAYEPYLPHENGIYGQWIRPEDVEKYEKYIDVLEFYTEGSNKVQKEAAMYKIYAEDKTWPGNLNLIIDNLNFNVDNRLFYAEDNLAERRMNCKHKCMIGACRFCESQFQFESVLRSYAKTKEEN
jgi:hypothetical protein